MLNWRMVWSSISTRVCPPLYRRWRFNRIKTLSWTGLGSDKTLEPELLILPEFLSRSGCFLDVGANNGAYLWAAMQRKGAGEIVAVEPIPFLSGLLKRAFPRVAIHNLALTDGEGPRWLKIPDIGGRTYSTRATLNVDYREEGETGRQLIQVSTSTLDAFWKKLGDPPLACVKIDTEGHEFSVLKGAVATLEKHRPMLMVEIEQRHHQGDGDIGEVFSFLADKGYRCFYFDPSVPAMRELSDSLVEVRAVQGGDQRYLNNFFFLPSDRSDGIETLALVNRRLAENALTAV